MSPAQVVVFAAFSFRAKEGENGFQGRASEPEIPRSAPVKTLFERDPQAFPPQPEGVPTQDFRPGGPIGNDCTGKLVSALLQVATERRY
jgi:hypothetical protein